MFALTRRKPAIVIPASFRPAKATLPRRRRWRGSSGDSRMIRSGPAGKYSVVQIFHTSSGSLGGNDEYFRQNYERDLRHHGLGNACRRYGARKRYGSPSRRHGIGRGNIGCGDANRRCRAHPRQGGCRQERKAGMAHLDRRPDEGARHRFQHHGAQGARQGARLHRRHQRFHQHEYLAA
jgi:hypothetical protein